MRCPFCQSLDHDRVVDTRASDDGTAIRRRRECSECSRRFTTYEQIEELSIRVVKKDKTRVPFERSKIKQGLQKACWKRPVSEEQIENLVRVIENRLYETGEREVGSIDLGEMVMEELRKLDQVAYVRFASVYREFKDAQDFVRELGQILEDKKKR